AQLDAPEEAEVRVGRDLVELGRHVLDLLVIRGHAEADQPEGHRQPVEHVDPRHQPLLSEDLVGRVEAGGSGADDGDAQGSAVRPGAGHQAPKSCDWRVSTSPAYRSRWALTTSPIDTIPTRRPWSMIGRCRMRRSVMV